MTVCRARRSHLMLLPLLTVLAGPAQSAVLTMGAGGTYSTLADAVAAAMAGDTIQIAPGTYVDQVATINIPLTIQGSGGPVIFTQSAAQLPGLKGFLVTNADTTVKNITFQNASISDSNGGNGAGIRYQAGNLTVINSQFNHNQDGILATPGTAGTGSIVITDSSFTGNGVGSGPLAGFEHGIYIGVVNSLSVLNSTFQGTLVGHDIKSRAANSTISGNTLDDGVTGTTSYAIDLPNGGLDTISHNTITQGPNTQNSTMVSYSEEDVGNVTWASNSLTVFGNLFDNSNGSSIGVNNASVSVTAVISCNAFDNVGTIVRGNATLSGNVTSGGVPACGQGVPEPPAIALTLTGLLMLAAARFGRRQVRPRLVA